MWGKKNKEKEEKRVVTTTQTRHVTQTTQTFAVRTTVENRSRSISIAGQPSLGNKDLFSSSSVSRINDKNMLALPVITKASSATNIGRIGTDAQSVVKPSKPVNLNYQSPYRNSPQYSSMNYKSRPSTISTGTANPYKPPASTFNQYRPPPITPSTNMTFRRELPATVIPASKLQNSKIVVKKTGKLYDSSCPVPTYSTHSKNRGEVLIINNVMFKDKAERHGAKVDDENLQNLFKQMGFKVILKRDLKKPGMISQVKSFSERSSLKNVDIAIVVVMSHGTKNTTLGGTEVFGLDEQGVLVDDLIEHFNEADCKYLADKPKIFIFQCCRGDNEQFVESDAQRIPSKKSALTNALIAYSTLPGYVSHRDPVSGTWYIKTMCDVFSQHAHEYHVEDLLKMVDVKLSGIVNNIKQTTNYENRGFKRCYLHPV